MEVGEALEGFATHESNLLLTQGTRNVVDILSIASFVIFCLVQTR